MDLQTTTLLQGGLIGFGQGGDGELCLLDRDGNPANAGVGAGRNIYRIDLE